MSNEASEQPVKPGWRIKLAFVLFVASLLWPVVPALASMAGMSAATLSAVSGAGFVAAEIMGLTAVAIAGKDGFKYIKAEVLGVFKAFLKGPAGAPKPVSKTRYTIGLVMLGAAALVGWATPYFLELDRTEYMYVAAACDVCFVLSLVVLGDGFWAKVRALFVHSAYVVFPR